LPFADEASGVFVARAAAAQVSEEKLRPLTPQEWTALVHLRREYGGGIKKKRGWTLAAMRQEYLTYLNLAKRRNRSDEWKEDKRVLDEFYWLVSDEEERVRKIAQQDCPIGWFKPSYEQAQMLNFWHPEFEPDVAPNGYGTCLNFGSVRSGKTWAAVISALMWMGPNNQDWVMFEPYTDHRGRLVQVKRRFKWDEWKRSGRMIYDDSEPPKSTCEIWQGCVDETHWKTKIERYYRQWCPDKWINRKGRDREWYSSDKWFRTTNGSMLIAKLYNSEMQSWGGQEMFQINLDEAPTPDKLEEVVFRTRYLIWTFTPREAANIGEKTLVAKNAWEGKTKLTGHPDTPPFKILPKMEDIPPHMMDPDELRKRIAIADSMGEKGKAAKGYGFFNSSPQVFNNFDRAKHVLPFGGEEAKRKWPDAVLIRGFDEGTSHPTAVIWVMILRTGEYVIYRDFAEAGLSVSERCTKIIELSRNQRVITHEHWDTERIRYKEEMTGERIRRTFADSKIFRRNPETVQDDWIDSYTKRGLRMERATNLGPAARCDFVNDMLLDDTTRQHLVTGLAPGHKLYVTNDCVEIIERFENYLQEQLKSGPNKGDFTGNPAKRGDDLVDAMCYCCASKMRWIDMTEVERRRMADQSAFSVGSSVTGY
jgi:hypothetical protein